MDPANIYGMADLNTIMNPTAPLQAFQQAQAQGLQRQLATQQIQREMRQQATADAATQAALANPNADNLTALTIARPDIAQALKSAHEMQDEATQRQSLQHFTGIYNYLDPANPKPDKATALIQQYHDAAKNAGQDTGQYDTLLDTVRTNPAQARMLAGMYLAGNVGADKLAATLGAFGSEQRARSAEPGKEALTAAQTAEANANATKTTNPPPETMSAGIGPDGQPIFYNKNAPPPPNSVAASSGTNNGALNGFVQQLLASENSTGNPAAKNPNSSATGNGQFVDKTWLDVVGKYRPDLVQGKTPAQILAMRADPALSAQMAGAYAQDNAATLQASGLPVNTTTLAMAHKVGPGAAQVILQADPGATMVQALTSGLGPEKAAEIIKANPQLGKLTAGQYGLSLKDKFGATPIDTTPGDPNATGADFLKTLPPARARMIQAIANGDLALPPAVGRNAQQSQLMLQQVMQYDPTATAINLPVRKATQEAFTKGTQGQTINSLNTFAGHADKLNDAITQLDNTPVGMWNAVAQGTGQAVGNAKTQKAVANFNTWKGLASNEIVKVLRGTAGAEGDIKYWQSQLDSAKSPVALHQVVQSMAQAVQTRLDSLQNEYNTGMATLGKPVPQVMPSTRAILERLGGGGTQQASNAPAQQVAINPQTGARAIYDPASRQWKPG